MKSEGIRPSRGYLTAIFFLMILILFLAYTVWDSRDTIVEMKQREERLVAERDSLRLLIGELDRPREQRTLLSQFDIHLLKRRGLHDPVKEITDDLIARTDLIPYEGVLGGEMGFYSPENIHILSGNWVFAYFEDGHVRGEMLLEYSVAPQGSISWEVIDAKMDQ
jgi:hypothetical protein